MIKNIICFFQTEDCLLNVDKKVKTKFYLNKDFQYIKTRHSFNLVDPSPWPLVSALGVFMLATGGVLYMHKFVGGERLLLTGLFVILYSMYTWWRDVIREATFEEQHTFTVQRGLRLGMILFIVSEIMFFFWFFWAFFHSSLAPVFNIGGVWPPEKINPIATLGVPLTNTFFLLSLGATVIWAHHAIIVRAKRQAIIALIFTLVLATLFTSLQILEYWWGGALEVIVNIGEQTFSSSTLPLTTSRFQVLIWCFKVINKLYIYFLQAELMLIITAVSGFFLLTAVRKKKDPLLGKLARLYVKLPLINKFFLVLFTIFVAIPNKFWINNKINGFPAFLIATSVLMMAYIYPILFCCYFMYFSLMLESFTFGLSYEYVSWFSTATNMLLFGDSNHEIAPEYFLFFWGKMFRAALKKFGSTGVATIATVVAVVAQRNTEIHERQDYAFRSVDHAVQHGVVVFTDKEHLNRFRREEADRWTLENGLITKIEMILKEATS
jgi:heme/copper-type cytochrome/quinol oxidase subunit 3